MQNEEFLKKEQLVLDLLQEKTNTISAFDIESYTHFYTKVFNISDDTEKKYADIFIRVGFLLGLDIISIDTGKAQTEFGFLGCFDTLCPCLTLYTWSIKANKNINIKIKDDIYAQIVSYEREHIDFATYCSNLEYYEKDIDTLIEALIPKNNDIGEGCKKEIEELNMAIFKDFVSIIESRYKYLLSPILDGIESYKGVILTDGSNDIIKIGNKSGKENHTAVSFVDEQVSLRMFTNALCTGIKDGYNISTAKNNPHQFDINQIYANVNSGSVLYFPYKILELATASKFSIYAQVTYKGLYGEESKHRSSFESYFKYITPNLKKISAEYLYLVLQHYVIDNENVAPKDIKEIDRLIAKKITEEENGAGPRYLMSTPFWKEHLLNYYTYFIDCITTGYILADYKENKQQGNISVADFRVKCCGPVSDKPVTTESFINSLPSIIVDGGIPVREGENTYKAENDSSGEIKTNSVSGSHFEYTMQDYAYTPNFTQANALPLFAYKALQQLKEKDPTLQLGYSNILLGRDDQNNIVYANRSGGKGNINFGGHNTHLLIAGSRSGKGVMTYNLIVTAIADNMPVFYMDGKPDTAVALRALNSNIYCVDNAQQTDVMDNRGLFAPETRGFGTESTGFNTPLVPQYIKANRTVNAFGVISYYRGVMLPLAMVAYASKHPEKPFSQHWNSIVGKTGFVMVLDELSNYIKFYSRLFGVRGAISKTIISTEGVSKITKPISDASAKNDKAINTLMSKIRTEQAKDEKKRDNIAIEQWEKEIEDLRSEQSETRSTFPIEDLYWSNFMATVNQNSAYLASKRDAGSILDTIQVICIGQNVQDILKCVDPQQTPETFTNVKGGCGYLTSTSDGKRIPEEGIPWLQLLLTSPLHGGDIIIGYNNGFSNYGGANKDKIMSSHLSAKKRGFAHRELSATKGAGTYAERLRDVTNPNSNEPYKDYTRFRPYLILNDAKKPPVSLLAEGGADLTNRSDIGAKRAHTKEDGSYVAQCLTNVEEALYGQSGTQEEYADAWEQFKFDNQPDEFDAPTEEINGGIGFEGYITRLGAGDAISQLGVSGDLATEFVQEVYSYPGTWQEFLDDMRPEYFIDLQDVESGHSVQGLLGNFLLNDTIKRSVTKTYTPESCSAVFGSLSSYYFSATNNVQTNDSLSKQDQQPISSVTSTQQMHFEPESIPTPRTNVLADDTVKQFITNIYNQMANSLPKIVEVLPLTINYLDTIFTIAAPVYRQNVNNIALADDYVKQKIMDDYENKVAHTAIKTDSNIGSTTPISLDMPVITDTTSEESVKSYKEVIRDIYIGLIDKLQNDASLSSIDKVNLIENMDTIVQKGVLRITGKQLTIAEIKQLRK